jgi:hypothetical protein
LIEESPRPTTHTKTPATPSAQPQISNDHLRAIATLHKLLERKEALLAELTEMNNLAEKQVTIRLEIILEINVSSLVATRKRVATREETLISYRIITQY